ncbi:MAG TPA: hypothetical protein VE913_17740 [Longimicrobium sp.]|nr:hypothetical protein [Longimicrobium sp.]
MVAFPLPQRLILPIASTGGGVAAALVGIAMLVAPASLLETAVMASGLPAVLAAAEPPLGFTARIGLALVAALTLGGGLWFALHWMFGSRALALPLRQDSAPAAEPAPLPEGAPILRRADAHPDAPARRPLMAAEELGTPFLEVRAARKPAIKPPVERALPRDLDAPLADFDPDAVPEVPAEPVRAVAPLARPAVQAPGERFETFQLPVPLAKRAPADKLNKVTAQERILAPRTEATIHALLDRLERGVASRPRIRPAPLADTRGLQDTLAELRQMAARAS